MDEHILANIRDLIQEDIGGRGLRTAPDENLITACPSDFAGACRSIAETPAPALAIVTGFFIPHAEPPCGETDGPLGAVFLARALAPLGTNVVLISDLFCKKALEVGIAHCGLTDVVPIFILPPASHSWDFFLKVNWPNFRTTHRLTHLIALERVGPSHTDEPTDASGPARNDKHCGRCYTMSGRDITANMCPAHLLFEKGRQGLTTIGIGDGGNEIGMGKIPRQIIERNIPNAPSPYPLPRGGGEGRVRGLVACRVATDFLVVCGVSNWGAYGLAAGVRLLRGAKPDAALFDVEKEGEILRLMVEHGPLVDGVTGKRTVTVDGLDFDRYGHVLNQIERLSVPI